MSNISLTFNNLTPALAVALIQASANVGASGSITAAGAMPPPAGGAPLSATPPPPTAAPAPAAPMAPSTAPVPQASAPPPAPAPAPAANPAGQGALAAMQEYAKTHKAAGVKAVLAKCNLTALTQANAEQLTWLEAAFRSNRAPAELG